MFAVLLGLFILGACGSGAEQSSGENTKSSEEKGQSSGSYTVKHAMGSTTIEGTPERVVILTNEGTEALLAMGVQPVGAVKSWLGNPWYDHIAEQMKGVKVVGTESNVNLEAIAELHPDLIIGNKLRQEKIYDKLSAIAPTVFSETLKGNWKINFELYAKALNKQEKGEQVMNAFDERIQSIRDRLGDKIDMEVSLVRFLASDIRIYHKDSFAGVILEQIGFNRPPNQDKDDFALKNVTKEMIPKMDGDILFYYTYAPNGDKAPKVEEEWTSSQLWQNLDAVKAGKAYKVSDAIWNTAGGVIAANRMLDDIEKFFHL
ncbi:MAG TPA: iron-siderophore ABC transporter substrate-binding protein [Bacillales bacterium]|nr:iron-siderophore ABC transporter substrate-binding protein [Bacillales bacterium]